MRKFVKIKAAECPRGGPRTLINLIAAYSTKTEHCARASALKRHPVYDTWLRQRLIDL